MYCHTKRGHIIRQLHGFLGSSIFAAHAENARAFARFFFLPRVLRPVGDCDPTTTILGYPSSLPIFVSGAALAKLGHPLGEINITIGVYTSPQNHLIQMVSSNASLPFHEIAKAARPDQTLFFQLYKPQDNILAEQRVRAVEGAGYKAIFLTVDAIVNARKDNTMAKGHHEIAYCYQRFVIYPDFQV